jgi:hypothetical protein
LSLGTEVPCRRWRPDFDILRVEFVALIEIVSGSPLN